jgi:hypothetical protein
MFAEYLRTETFRRRFSRLRECLQPALDGKDRQSRRLVTLDQGAVSRRIPEVHASKRGYWQGRDEASVGSLFRMEGTKMSKPEEERLPFEKPQAGLYEVMYWKAVERVMNVPAKPKVVSEYNPFSDRRMKE